MQAHPHLALLGLIKAIKSYWLIEPVDSYKDRFIGLIGLAGFYKEKTLREESKKAVIFR